jgi:hypothetical protein
LCPGIENRESGSDSDFANLHSRHLSGSTIASPRAKAGICPVQVALFDTAYGNTTPVRIEYHL